MGRNRAPSQYRGSAAAAEQRAPIAAAADCKAAVAVVAVVAVARDEEFVSNSNIQIGSFFIF